jgi:hypothetical protein
MRRNWGCLLIVLSHIPATLMSAPYFPTSLVRWGRACT